MKVKHLLVLLVSILFVGIMAGCNNTVEKAPTEPSKNEQGKLLATIKTRGKLIVGTEAAFAPFEYVENGKIVGYGPDILAEIVKNMGVELKQLDVPFTGILSGLEEKKFDFVEQLLLLPRKEKKNLL